MLKRSTIQDARGARVLICRRRDLPPGCSARLRKTVNQANFHTLAGLWYVLFGVVAVLAIAALFTLRTPSSGGPSMSSMLISQCIAGAAAAIVTAVVIWAVGSRTFARAAASHCLRERICPSCGYRLDGLTPESDGCTVCPECAAAWRVGTVEA